MRRFWVFMLSIIVMASLMGCASTLPGLNLNYSPIGGEAVKKNIRVALVKPVYTGAQKFNNQFSNSIMGQLIESQMPPEYRLTKKYNSEYVLKVENAMVSDMEKIIIEKGLVSYRSFDTYDEVTYSDKKNVDLILIPEFDFGPEIHNKRTVIPIISSLIGPLDKGTIMMTGKIKLVFQEPMSKEAIIIKNIDVSGLGIETIMQYQGTNMAEESLVTYINKLYPALMDKLYTMIDEQEISASINDIKVLKERAQN